MLSWAPQVRLPFPGGTRPATGHGSSPYTDRPAPCWLRFPGGAGSAAEAGPPSSQGLSSEAPRAAGQVPALPPPSSMPWSRPRSPESCFGYSGHGQEGKRAISLRGHLGAQPAGVKNSPVKPEVMAFWAQASWFSCPTCFRTDRFCAAQGKCAIGFGRQAGPAQPPEGHSVPMCPCLEPCSLPPLPQAARAPSSHQP